MFWGAVPANVAMAACGHPLGVAWSSHRIGYCRDVSDKTLKRAIHGSRVASDHFRTAANHVANARKRIGGAGRSPGLCRDSN